MRGLVAALLLLSAGLVGCIGDEDPGEEGLLPQTVPVEDFSRPAGDGGPDSSTAGGGADADGGEDDGPEGPPRVPLQADPNAPGPLNVTRTFYNFGLTVVNASHSPRTYPAQLNGSIHYPTEGDGPYPVLVFQHGRHTTCRVLDTTEVLGTHACPDVEPALDSIDSFSGYAYIGEVLASHGYVVASVNANQVNDRDQGSEFVGFFTGGVTGPTGDFGAQARAQIVLRTLDALDQVHQGEDPGAPLFDNGELVDGLEGRLDISRVGLMGHSRGGEGVTYAVTYNQDRVQGEPHALQAVFALAPIDANDVTAPGVAFATLLPYCDGDVQSLSGALIYDDSRYLGTTNDAPKHQFVAMGANHNYYNTVWTGDDAGNKDDPFCGELRADGGGRLSPEDQRAHGLALISAFLRTYVGGEIAFEPWLEGATLPPVTACPESSQGNERGCPGLIHTSYHPAPRDRLVLENLLDGELRGQHDLGGEVALSGFEEASVCQANDCPSQPNAQRAAQATLVWQDPARYELFLPTEHRDVARFQAFSFRAGVNFDAEANPDGQPQDLTVELRDTGGTVARVPASAYTEALFHPPGEDEDTPMAKVTLSAVRIPLSAFGGVDLEDVRSVSLVFDRTPSGSLQVTDLMFQR